MADPCDGARPGDEIAAAVRAAVQAERDAVCQIVEDFAALNEDEDGPRYPGLAEWLGNDDDGRFVIDPDRLVEIIRSRPATPADAASRP